MAEDKLFTVEIHFKGGSVMTLRDVLKFEKTGDKWSWQTMGVDTFWPVLLEEIVAVKATLQI